VTPVPRLATPLALLCALLCTTALAACGGGGGKSDAENTVKDFVKAVDSQDTDKFCNKLVSDSFLEGSFGGKGSDAKKQCRTQLKALKNVNLKLVRIKKTTVKGDKASVTVVLDTGGQQATQVLPLVKQDGDWRVSTLAPGGG
jgi:hypothetical protein